MTGTRLFPIEAIRAMTTVRILEAHRSRRVNKHDGYLSAQIEYGQPGVQFSVGADSHDSNTNVTVVVVASLLEADDLAGQSDLLIATAREARKSTVSVSGANCQATGGLSRGFAYIPDAPITHSSSSRMRH